MAKPTEAQQRAAELEEVAAFQADFEAGKAALTMDLMDFLKNWLKEHIMGTDMQYAPFFKEKGL